MGKIFDAVKDSIKFAEIEAALRMGIAGHLGRRAVVQIHVDESDPALDRYKKQLEFTIIVSIYLPEWRKLYPIAPLSGVTFLAQPVVQVEYQTLPLPAMTAGQMITISSLMMDEDNLEAMIAGRLLDSFLGWYKSQ